MKTFILFNKNLSFLFIILFILHLPWAKAQWSVDPTVNTLICNAARDQREPTFN
jgi:hypothetical protein